MTTRTGITTAHLVLTASLWLSTCLTAQTVWVVDDDGGPEVPFTDIQPAIQAAVAGDTILVRPGRYGTVALGTKTLPDMGIKGAANMAGGMAAWQQAGGPVTKE